MNLHANVERPAKHQQVRLRALWWKLPLPKDALVTRGGANCPTKHLSCREWRETAAGTTDASLENHRRGVRDLDGWSSTPKATGTEGSRGRRYGDGGSMEQSIRRVQMGVSRDS